MKKETTIYQLKHVLSSLLMILALLWLTISIPFVLESRQYLKDFKEQAPVKKNSTEQTANPLANSTEEKTVTSPLNSLSEEYVHEIHQQFHLIEIFLHHKNHHSVPEYLAFHEEMISPPPEA